MPVSQSVSSPVKAWGTFNSGGLIAGKNIASVTYSTGQAAVVFTSNMADTNYSVTVTCHGAASNVSRVAELADGSKTISGFTIKTFDVVTPTSYVNAPQVDFVVCANP